MSLQDISSKMILLIAIARWVFFSFSFCEGTPTSSSATILMRLKQSAEDDPEQTLQNWSSNISPCNWSGVACSDQGDVVSLSLHHLKFRSSSVLFSTIDQLHGLQDLDLSMNDFSAADFCIYKDNPIRRLRLAFNSFKSVAISVCENLTELHITTNVVSNQLFDITTSSSCFNLKILNISSNNFSGDSFPAVIASFPSLQIVDASYNNFDGSIPSFHSKHLQHLDLSSNRFNAIGANDFCARSPDLTTLLLVNNAITQAFHEVMNCSRLKMLDVSFNLLAEEIPINFCDNLQQLAYLLAWANKLHGEIPVNLVTCLKLVTIFLSHNNFSGSIPPELFQLQELKWLSLSNNKLAGTIPSVLNLYELLVLQASNNKLEGRLPEQLPFHTISLQNNRLTDAIPLQWGLRAPSTSSEAKILPLKEMLGSLKPVGLTHGYQACCDTFMALQGIKLDSATRILDSRSTGCSNIDVRYLPISYVTSTRSTLSIDIRSNRLEGSIPEGISNMRDLLYIYLADNRFTGEIPGSLGTLESLLFLNLSRNRLSGSIPSSFSQLTLLNTLDVSCNNLSGLIPQAGQLSTLEARSFEGNPGLCGRPLLTECNSTSNSTSEYSAAPRYKHFDDVYIVGLVFGSVSFIVSFTTTFLRGFYKL